MDTIPIQLNELSEWLEGYMRDRFLSVQGLAKELGISRQTVYNVLAGGWPSREVMDKLGVHLVAPRAPKVTERETEALER